MVSIVAEIGLTLALSVMKTSFTKMHDASMYGLVIVVTRAYIPNSRTLARRRASPLWITDDSRCLRPCARLLH